DQVPLLMSMQEDELALGKAIASGDTDLVYLALLHIRKHRKQKDFFALIKDKPLARDLYIAYCKQADLPALKVRMEATDGGGEGGGEGRARDERFLCPARSVGAV